MLAVALGAFGAHALKATLTASNHLQTWQTAVQYHAWHALALVVLADKPTVSNVSRFCFAAGILLFSGSLYLLALFDLRWLGPITPLGGVAFLLGWGWLALGRHAEVSSSSSSPDENIRSSKS